MKRKTYGGNEGEDEETKDEEEKSLIDTLGRLGNNTGISLYDDVSSYLDPDDLSKAARTSKAFRTLKASSNNGVDWSTYLRRRFPYLRPCDIRYLP